MCQLLVPSRAASLERVKAGSALHPAPPSISSRKATRSPCVLAEAIQVPGATTSGRVRPLLVGPSELNGASWDGSSPSGPAAGRRFSQAPTARQFLAVAGEPTEPTP